MSRPLPTRPLLLLALALPASAGDFSNVAGSVGANTSGGKDGGVNASDFNNDGWPDLLVNREGSSRLYFWDPSRSRYDDVTEDNADGLDDNETERSAIAADLNNDGYVDFAVNTSEYV